LVGWLVGWLVGLFRLKPPKFVLTGFTHTTQTTFPFPAESKCGARQGVFAQSPHDQQADGQPGGQQAAQP
jgi:hypothetical protein